MSPPDWVVASVALDDGVESSPGGALRDGSAEDEIRDLRRALRESRLRLRRSAGESTRWIVSLTNEVQRLSELYARMREQLACYELSAAIVQSGYQRMRQGLAGEPSDEVVW